MTDQDMMPPPQPASVNYKTNADFRRMLETPRAERAHEGMAHFCSPTPGLCFSVMSIHSTSIPESVSLGATSKLPGHTMVRGMHEDHFNPVLLAVAGDEDGHDRPARKAAGGAPAQKKKSRPKPAHLEKKEDPDEPAYRRCSALLSLCLCCTWRHCLSIDPHSCLGQWERGRLALPAGA